MKKFSIYSIIIFCATVLQASSVPALSGSAWLPDVVLMLVLAWTLLDGFDSLLPWAVFAGILYDLATFSPLGSHVIIFALVAYGVSFFSKRFSADARGGGIFLMVFFVISSTLGSRWLLSFHGAGFDFFRRDFSDLWNFSKMFFFASFCNLLIFAILFLFVGKVEKFFYLKKNDRVPLSR
ncbi:MAG TPA: rod shape-determining protein MreD [Candidatus Moranbacteria bacterium]|nr:rod shape-determining protein MreD [Candidatus Moranbacteria bacterium]